jgi:two-component system, cell cycle sensor histidine kinase and response regulator CckA
MKASKAITGFTGHIQNQLTLSAMRVRQTKIPETLKSAGFDKVVDPASLWLVVAALTIAVVTLGAVSSQTGQPILFTVLSFLAVCGLFFLLSALSGRIEVGHAQARSIRLPQQSIADAWPEAALITTPLGVSVYQNEAYNKLVPRFGGGGLAGLESWCASQPRAAESLFRLIRAGERGEPWSELIDIYGNDRLSGTSLKISVTPVEAGRLAAGPLVIWRLSDLTVEREFARQSRSGAESRLEAYNASPVGLFTLGANETVVQMNATLRQLLGLGLSDAIGRRGALQTSEIGAQPPPQLDVLFSPASAEILRRHLRRNDSSRIQCALDMMVRNSSDGQLNRRIAVRIYGAGAPSGTQAVGERTFAVFKSEWVEPALISPHLDHDTMDPSFARHFESAPFGIATITNAGRISRANPAFATMVLDSSGSLDAPALECVCREASAEARTAIEHVMAEALAGQSGLAPVDFSTGPKECFGRRVYVTPLVPSPGSNEAAILYIVDTTEQKALEAKFAQSQKMEAVGKLAGGIAHDFNNVLTAIIGSADLMLQTHRASDAAHKDIQNIKQSANRAAGLVGKLMAFSRQQTLQLEVLALGDVVTDLRQMLKTLLGEKIDLQITTGRDVWYVKADRTQIDQILLNFAGNAQHAMPDGGSFAVRTRNVTEREVQKLPYAGIQVAEYVLIEVEDTGSGMPPEVLAKIFEPFFTTKEVGKGTGLGLATVYGIVKQSSGYIFTESVPGRGTTFRVYLPRVHVENVAEFVAQRAVKKELSTADLTGTATVLIVEDEDMVRSVAVRSLTRFGYKVLEAGNGIEALDVLAEHPGTVDIVVSDVVMPEMDGPAFLKEVRKTHPDLKIIFVSGHTNEAFKASVDENEIFAFLPKPFSLPQLVAKVKEELSR